MDQQSINDSLKLIYCTVTSDAYENDHIRVVELLKILFKDIELFKNCLSGNLELDLARELAALGLDRAEKIADYHAQKLFINAVFQLATPTQPQFIFAKSRLS